VPASQSAVPYIRELVSETNDDPNWRDVLAALDAWAAASGRYRDLDALRGKPAQGDPAWAKWEEAERRAISEIGGWAELSDEVLTHDRLAQLVPVVGGVVSAGLSYDMLGRALKDATRIYRVRYLAEKYGLSFDDWVEQTMANDAAEPSDDATSTPAEEPIDVEAVLRAVISEHDHHKLGKARETEKKQSTEDSP
jgi:hypothetical protein